jgi:hypothetical protein
LYILLDECWNYFEAKEQIFCYSRKRHFWWMCVLTSEKSFSNEFILSLFNDTSNSWNDVMSYSIISEYWIVKGEEGSVWGAVIAFTKRGWGELNEFQFG